MANDVLITPAGRKIEFKDSDGNVDAVIQTDASGNLEITNVGGNISIGDTTSDVYIGDGTNNVDIVFEQNGEIRGTSGVTVTLGASGATTNLAGTVQLGGTTLTATGTELNYTDGVTSNIQTQLNAKASTSIATTSANGLMSSSDKTKIDGIESLADVTDATNVAAAGALMDSEVTNLAQVKAFDSADYATAAQGTTADNALPKAGGTLTGQLISTRANSTAIGTGQIYLNGATGNRIDFNTSGVSAPTFTTRSAGTKLVLYPGISASAADYALGIEAGALWYGVLNTSSQFKWYAGTSNVMTLSGAGVLTATTFSGALSGNATTATTLQTARTINGVSFNGSADITVPVPPRAVAASGTSGTLSPNSDTTDIFNAFGLTGAVTFNVPTGTPVDGQRLVLRLRDSGSDQGLTWTTTSGGYRVIGTTLPSTTTASKLLYVGCIYNSTDSFWDVVAVTTEA